MHRLLLLLACLPTAIAGSMQAFSDLELCERADQVVVGTVLSRETRWYNADTMLTKVTLSVDLAIIGTPGPTVTVSTLGGTIGNQTQHVGGEPTLPLGSRYLLMMHGTALIAGTAYPTDAPPEQLIAAWESSCTTAAAPVDEQP